MHELYELKDKLMKELEDYGSKEMSAGTLEVVDKLAHTVKNLCKIIEEAEYSEASGGSYEGGMTAGGGGSYARGGGGTRGGGSSRAMRGGSYAGGGGSYEGGSYARGGGRGRGGNARRDSMGRYSSAGDFAEELRELMEDAPDERTRMELEKLANKMERM